MKTLVVFSDWKDMMHYAPFEIQGVFPYYSNIIQIMVSTMGNKLYFSKPIIIKNKGKDYIKYIKGEYEHLSKKKVNGKHS